jgi:hypothetical protein
MEDPELEEFLSQLDLSLEEKEHTRQHKYNPDIECLQGLAQQLFERKDKQSDWYSKSEALRRTVNEVAAIVSRTYAERGDYARLSDDDALILIREVLLRYNPTIIKRNKKKRLPNIGML